MQTITTIQQMNEYSRAALAAGKSVGFVPTMGYLHDGHCSLIRRSAAENDVTIVSVFVNPTQFSPNEDFASYPRDIEADTRLSAEAGAAVIFLPSADEMYPDGYKTYVEVDDLTAGLCGKSRPTHFRGVTTVIAKLFNIVMPTRAYFGQKDAQQLIVLRKMAYDLNMGVEVIACPIVRESDGLAKSSRNVYLTADERSRAVVLSMALTKAKQMYDDGERNSGILRVCVESIIASGTPSKIDYIEIADTDTLTPVDTITAGALIAVAVKFGNTRLIDNILVG